MPILEADEEVKEGKGLQILPPNNQLTRLPVFLAQTKAEHISNKLKTKIRQILYFFINIIKITKKI